MSLSPFYPYRASVSPLTAVLCAWPGPACAATPSPNTKGPRASPGRTAEAIEHYRAALTIDPGNLLARANLAIALGRSGRVAEAIPEMLDVSRRSPSDPRWHYIVAMMWLQKEKTGEAAAQLKEALRLNPGFEDARRALAEIRD